LLDALLRSSTALPRKRAVNFSDLAPRNRERSRKAVVTLNVHALLMFTLRVEIVLVPALICTETTPALQP